MPSKRYRKLTAKDLLKEYGEGNRDFPNVNLRGQNLKKANLQGANFSGSQLQGANFSEASLQNCDFSDTRLHRANFSKAKLTGAKFNNTETGMGFCRSLLSFAITFIVSFVGIIFAISLCTLFASHLYSQITKTQYMITIAYIVVSIVGFWHFWVITLFKNIDEAVWGILVTILTILLFMLNQPLTNVLAWCIILGGGIRLTKVLFDWKHLVAFIPTLSFIFIILVFLYGYEFILDPNNSFLLNFFYGVLLASLISSPIVAIAWVQLNIITYLVSFITYLKRKVKVIRQNPFLMLFFLIVFSPVWVIIIFIFFIALLYIILLGIFLLPGSPGIYIGWQALRDNPKYRLIRDCGVWLSNRFGTNFRGADLTNADFSDATVNNANFTKANLKHTRWHRAKRMQYARFGNSYLRYSKIRKLMINSDSLVEFIL